MRRSKLLPCFHGQVTRVLSCTTQLIGVIKTKTSGKIYSQHLKHISSHVRLSCQSWYQLGSLYSSNCKDQSEFMARIKELVKEGAFTQQEEIIKFLFVIHNTNDKVREYLIDKADPTKTCSDFLNLARSVESMVQTETMSKQLLQNVGKLSVSSVGQAKGQRQRSFSKAKQSDRNRSSSGRRSQSQNQSTCGKCGKRHPPRKCPAYGQNCRRCGAKGHCKMLQVQESKESKKPKGTFLS